MKTPNSSTIQTPDIQLPQPGRANTGAEPGIFYMKPQHLPFVVFLSATLLFLAFGQARVAAALYAYDAFAVVNTGSGNGWYDTGTATANPDFLGATFTITQGGNLLLGAQVKTNPGDGNPSSWGAEWARVFYRFDNSGAFSSLNLPAISGTPGTDWYVQFEQVNPASMASIGSALSAGSHILEIYFQAHDDTQPADGYVSRGGLNYTANIQVTAVPEPVNVALGVFGVLCAGVTAVRWRRKQLRSANPAN